MKLDLSIVTVCFNSEKTISETLASIRMAKKLLDFEYVVIDGNSKDRTREILEANKDIIDVMVSEPDGGIYFAMNKGVAKATRSYVLFINSDDLLSHEGLANIASELNSQKHDYICCSVNIAQEDGSHIGYREPGIKHGQKKYFGMPVPHQGLIVKKAPKEEHFFDTTYRIRADYDHLQKLINSSQSFHISKTRIATFRIGGASSSPKAKDERFVIDRKNHGVLWAYLFLSYASTSVFVQKFMPRKLIFLIKKLKKSPLLYTSVFAMGMTLT